jgi:hypothetical protein
MLIRTSSERNERSLAGILPLYVVTALRARKMDSAAQTA